MISKIGLRPRHGGSRPRCPTSCRKRDNAVYARERALDRTDLIFPILYIAVPALDDEAQWRNHSVLSVIGQRQYVDWRQFRHHSVQTTAVNEAIERFCSEIVDALRQSWVSPEERRRQEEAEARERAEEERRREEVEARRQAEGERQRQEAEAKRRSEEETRQRAAEEERRKREAEMEQRRKKEAEAKRREDEERKRAEVERLAEEERKRAKAEAERAAAAHDAQKKAEEARLKAEAAERAKAEVRRVADEAKAEKEETERERPSAPLSPHASLSATSELREQLEHVSSEQPKTAAASSTVPWSVIGAGAIISGVIAIVVAWLVWRPGHLVTPQPAQPITSQSTPPVTQPAPPVTPEDAKAMYGRGEYYLGEHDYANARVWYEKAAANGNTNAMLQLGGMYRAGHGVAQDYAKARELYQRAADEGNVNATYLLQELKALGH